MTERASFAIGCCDPTQPSRVGRAAPRSEWAAGRRGGAALAPNAATPDGRPAVRRRDARLGRRDCLPVVALGALGDADQAGPRLLRGRASASRIAAFFAASAISSVPAGAFAERRGAAASAAWPRAPSAGSLLGIAILAHLADPAAVDGGRRRGQAAGPGRDERCGRQRDRPRRTASRSASSSPPGPRHVVRRLSIPIVGLTVGCALDPGVCRAARASPPWRHWSVA